MLWNMTEEINKGKWNRRQFNRTSACKIRIRLFRMATAFRWHLLFLHTLTQDGFPFRSYFRCQIPCPPLINIKTIHSYQWQHSHRPPLPIRRYHASGRVIWPMIEDTSFTQHLDHFTYPCLWCCFSIGASIVRPFEQRVPSIKDLRRQKVSGWSVQLHF